MFVSTFETIDISEQLAFSESGGHGKLLMLFRWLLSQKTAWNEGVAMRNPCRDAWNGQHVAVSKQRRDDFRQNCLRKGSIATKAGLGGFNGCN